MRLHVIPTLGPVNLRALTPTHVRRLLANIAAERLGARSVQIIHSTLRTMLSEALREELIERNVATVVRPPSVERAEVQRWSTRRPAASWPQAPIIACMHYSRSVLLWVCGKASCSPSVGTPSSSKAEYSTSAKRAAAARDGPRLRSSKVKKVASHNSASCSLGEGASNPPRKSGSRSPCTWTRLGRLRPGLHLCGRHRDRAAKSEPLFDELIAKARVRRIRFHDLRHTCAPLLLAQNVPARVVMEILGHSQLAMTTDLYIHVMPTALREAADAMDLVLVQPN